MSELKLPKNLKVKFNESPIAFEFINITEINLEHLVELYFEFENWLKTNSKVVKSKRGDIMGYISKGE